MKSTDNKTNTKKQNTKTFHKVNNDITFADTPKEELINKISALEQLQTSLLLENEVLRKKIHEAENTASNYTNLYKSTPSAYFTLLKTGEIVDANFTGFQMLAYKKEDLINKQFLNFVSIDFQSIFKVFFNNMFISKKIETCLSNFEINSDQSIAIQITGFYNHKLEQYHLKAINISEIKKLAELNQILLTSLPYPSMYIRLSDRMVLSANKIAIDMGIKIGDYCWQVFGKSDNLKLEEKNKSINSSHFSNSSLDNKCSFCEADNCFEELMTRKKKEISALGKTWEINWIKVNDDVFLHYAIDISRRKQAQEERELLMAAAENSSNILVVKDLDLKIVAANKSYLEIIGQQSLNSIIGKSDAEILCLPPDDDLIKSNNEDDRYVQKLLKGEYIQKEEIFKLQNGNSRTLLSKKYPIYNKEGKLFCIGTVSLDITERKKAEEALQKSEQMLQNIIEHFPGDIFWKNKELKYLGCNQSFAIGEGFTNKHQIINKTDFDLIKNKKQAESYRSEDKRVMESGKEKLHKMERKRLKNGNITWYDSCKIPLRDTHGNIIGVMGVFTDITNRKMAEDALVKSEAKYREIIENSNDIIFICTKNGILSYISNACLKSLGLEIDEMIDRSLVQFIHPNDSQKFNDWMSKVLNSTLQPEESIEFRLKHKNGKWYWFSGSGLAIKDKNGKIKGIEGTATKIHERKLAEIKLRESEMNYRFLFANNPQPMWIIDYETEAFLEVNHAAMNHYGYSKEEFQSLTLRNIQLNKNRFAPLKKLNKDKQEYHLSLEEIHRTKNGNIIFVEITSHAVIYEGKNARHILVNDITKRKHAEDNLKQLNEKLEDIVKKRTSELLNSNASLKLAEEKFRTVADFTYGWEYWIDDLGNILYMSPSSEKVTGYTLEEFMIDPALIDKIVFQNDKDNWLNHKKTIYLGKKKKRHAEIIFRIVKKNGDVRWISSVCRSVTINGKYMGMRVSNLNITQKVKAENELLKVTVNVEERERNRYSRELHDGMGPLLSTIKLYFQWLSETDDPEKMKIITQKGNANIECAIQSSREIARGLSTQNLYKFGFVDTLSDFTERLNDTKKIDIKFNFNTEERFDNFVETTLYRISTELIKNTITYAKASLVTIDFHYNKDKKIIHLIYADNGIGFDLSNNENENKGMGVMNIQQRIKSLRGKFKIKSQIGKGMKVIIEFPIE